MNKIFVEELALGREAFLDFAEYFSGRDHFVFLDSRSNGNNLEKYSLFSFSPFTVFKSKGADIEIRQGNSCVKSEGNPFDCLKELYSNFKMPKGEYDSVSPFLGGGIGYFAYELGRHLEVLPVTTKDDLGIPECYFCLYNFAIVLDHQSGKMSFIYFEPEGLGAFVGKEELKNEIKSVPLGLYEKNDEYMRCSFSCGKLQSDFSPKQYIDTVNKIKDYIHAGDVYQVNLTQRFRTNIGTSDPWMIYKKLMDINPAPFSCYLNYEGVNIASSSPERFLKVIGGTVETRPIKGTIKRGKTAAEDKKYSEILQNSEKDRAELAMIVDLMRNDLARVCKPSTVQVRTFPEIETYSSVHHLVSTITGELQQDCDVFDLLKASFPGGSISGAPKIRAMEIIDELEPIERSLYTGCIGYIGFNGNTDLNIVIRTIVMKDGIAYLQAGGGVVADSVALLEYKESLLKAQRLIMALSNMQTKSSTTVAKPRISQSRPSC